MDQDLVTAFDLDQNGVLVLVETFGGKRHYYFYVASRYANERLSWKTRNDPEWGFIQGYATDFF